MRNLRYLVVLFIIIVLAPTFSILFPKNASAYGDTYIDNDDPAYSEYMVGSWTYRYPDSRSFRSDNRYNTQAAAEYYWDWGSKSNFSSAYDWEFYAYVNSYDFVNTTADYYDASSGYINYLDQMRAPGGWNYVGRIWSPKAPFSVRNYSGTGTGADGIYLKIHTTSY